MQINLSKRRLLLSASAGLILMGTTGSGWSQDQPRYGIEGSKAPELDVDYWIDGDGNPTRFSIAESSGKWIFLKCFQDWCPGCHSSGFPALKVFSDAFHDHSQVAIAGIQTVFEGFSSNTLEDVRKNQIKYELPIPMGHDPGDPNGDHRPNTMVSYRTGGTPWIIVIDPAGTVVFNDYHLNVEKLIEFVKQQIA